MKNSIYLLVLLLGFNFLSQPLFCQDLSGSDQFWNQLEKHCGKAYEGQLMTPSENDPFAGKKLIIHFISCDESEHVIKIPFHVGEDRSRTWVLKKTGNGLIQLKHDHRHEDGSEDEVTQYGGTTSNTGLPHLQMFPADQETANRIPYASHNVWWFTVDEQFLTYNLRRIGSDRLFTVRFDLTKSIDQPEAPWGWNKN
jgi:hypothetical protein